MSAVFHFHWSLLHGKGGYNASTSVPTATFDVNGVNISVPFHGHAVMALPTSGKLGLAAQPALADSVTSFEAIKDLDTIMLMKDTWDEPKQELPQTGFSE